MTLQIDVVTNALRARQDLDQITKSVEKIESATTKASRAFKTLAVSIAGTFTAMIGVIKANDASDFITKLDNSVKLYTKSAQEAVEVQKELFNITRRTFGDLESASTIFARVSLATGDKFDTKEILEVTEAIQNAFLISGSTAEEARSATIQFGQAMNFGKLRGQDFNSVMSFAPRLLFAIADGMGVTRDSLKSMADDGLLETELVLEAILSQFKQLEAEAGSFAPLISQSFEVMRDRAKLFFGSFLEGYGYAERMQFLLLGMADTFFRLSDSAYEFGRVLGNIISIDFLRRISNVTAALDTVFLGGFFGNLFDSMIASATAGLEAVLDIFRGFRDRLIDIFWFIYDVLVGNSIWTDDIIGGIIEQAASLWERIKGYFFLFASNVIRIFSDIKQFVRDVFSGTNIVSGVKDIGRGVVEFFRPWIDVVKSELLRIYDVMRAFFLSLYTRLLPYFQNVGTALWSFLPESFRLAIQAVIENAKQFLGNAGNSTNIVAAVFAAPEDSSIFQRIRDFGRRILDTIRSLDFAQVKQSFTDIFVPNFQKVGAAILLGILTVKSALFRSKVRLIALAAAFVAFFNTPLSTELAAGMGAIFGQALNVVFFKEAGEEGGRNYIRGFFVGILKANQAFGTALFENVGISERWAKMFGSIMALSFVDFTTLFTAAMIGAFFALKKAIGLVGAGFGAAFGMLTKSGELAAINKELAKQSALVQKIDSGMSKRELRNARAARLARGPGAIAGTIGGVIGGSWLATTLFPDNEVGQMAVTIGAIMAGSSIGAMLAQGIMMSILKSLGLFKAMFMTVIAPIGYLATIAYSGLAPYIAAGIAFAAKKAVLLVVPTLIAAGGFILGKFVDAAIGSDAQAGAIAQMAKGLLTILLGGIAIAATLLAAGLSAPWAIAAALLTVIAAAFLSDDLFAAVEAGFWGIVDKFTSLWENTGSWVGGIVYAISDAFRYLFDPERMLADLGSFLSDLGYRMGLAIVEGLNKALGANSKNMDMFRDNFGVEPFANGGPVGSPRPVGGRANGGFISGPGGPRSDSIPAMLSNGEFVINAAATRKFLPLLNAINSGNIGGFFLGGLVGRGYIAPGYNPKDVTSVGDWFEPGAHFSDVLNNRYGINDEQKIEFYYEIIRNIEGILKNYSDLTESWISRSGVGGDFLLDMKSPLYGAHMDPGRLFAVLGKPLNKPYDTLDEQLAIYMHEFGHVIDFIRQLAIDPAASYFSDDVLKYETNATRFAFNFGNVNGFEKLQGYKDILAAAISTYIQQSVNINRQRRGGFLASLFGSNRSTDNIEDLGGALDVARQSPLSSRELETLAREMISPLVLFNTKDISRLRGYATGGYISGPGGPREDLIPAMLSNGEFVINAASTRQFYPLLEAINSGNVKGFSGGGLTNTDKPAYLRDRLQNDMRSEDEVMTILKTSESIWDSAKGLFTYLINGVENQVDGVANAITGGSGSRSTTAPAGLGSTSGAGRGGLADNPKRALTSFEKELEALDKAFNENKMTVIAYWTAVEDVNRRRSLSPDGVREWAYESSREMTKNFRSEFMSAFSQLSKGDYEDGLKGFIESVLNTFTSQIIDSFTEAFIGGAFDSMGFDKLFNNIFEGMFRDMKFAATNAATGANTSGGGLFKWIGSILGFAEGGLVAGPGGPKSDSILARLSNGEYVVNARSTRAFLPLLEEINGYANGGYVGTVTPSNFKEQSSGTRQEFTINITGDVTEQTRKEVLKLIPQISQGVNTYNRERLYGN